MILGLLPFEHVFDGGHAYPASDEIHAVELLHHVLLDSARLLQHVLRQIQGRRTVGDVEDPEDEALMVDVVGELPVVLVLQPEKDLRNVEWRDVQSERQLLRRTPVHALVLLRMLEEGRDEVVSSCELLGLRFVEADTD